MIFVVHKDKPILFVLMTYEDEMKLREGRTLFVEPRMTGGRFFNSVVVSLHRTKDEIVAMLRSIEPTAKIPDHLPEPPPREGEFKCKACGHGAPPQLLFEETCTHCWAAEAKRYRAQSN